ncbi:MAG: hypothetical protein P9X27_06665 [Candidatus Kaelpia aquatica]|nr:hypothetical protein [Candidatus Kaelpia aquatica]
MKEIKLQTILKVHLKVIKVSVCNFLLKSYEKLLVSLTTKYLCAINTIDGEKRYEN